MTPSELQSDFLSKPATWPQIVSGVLLTHLLLDVGRLELAHLAAQAIKSLKSCVRIRRVVSVEGHASGAVEHVLEAVPAVVVLVLQSLGVIALDKDTLS